MAVASAGQVCTLLQTDNHTSTPPLCFLQAGCPSCRPTNSVKALKAAVVRKQSNTQHTYRLALQANEVVCETRHEIALYYR